MNDQKEDNKVNKSAGEQCSKSSKRRGLIKRILKWLGISLVTLLLVNSIIFQAPWKVITLLAIILAACTILPKQMRKWFWISAAGVAAVLIIWLFLPEDNTGWRPYTFDEESAALEAKYAIPNEENAALIYDELFKAMDRDPNEPKFFIKSSPSSKDGPWLSKDHPETAEWLKGYQSTIEELLQVANMGKCRFLPIAPDIINYPKYIERLPKIHRCTFLLVSSANNDIAEGRTDTALRKYICVIQIAKHLYQQPLILVYVTGFTVEYIALEQLNRFIVQGRPNAQQLQLVANTIEGMKNNWGYEWRGMLDSDKLLIKNMLCGRLFEVNPRGKMRLSRERLISREYQQNFPRYNYWIRKLLKVRDIEGWLYYPSTPQKFSELIDKSYEKYYATNKYNFDWKKEASMRQPRWKANFYFLLECLMLPSSESYYRIYEGYLKGLSFRRGSRLLVAIKKYEIENGSWPTNLDEIKSNVPKEAFIDPVSGNEFEYENIGKYFSLNGQKTNIWPR